jgi:hypothetical protein
MIQIVIRTIYVILFLVIVYFNIHIEENGFSIDITPLGTYATLFLSVLLVDVTYGIGKRQNDIAKRQNEIAEQQTEIQKRQYQIEKFNNYKDLHRDIYKCKCMFEAILPKIYEYFVAVEREMQNNSIEDHLEQITKLLSDVQSRVSDAMLRGDKQLDVQAVLKLLGGAGSLLIYAPQIAPRGMNTFDWRTTLVKGAEFKETLTIEEQAVCISGLVKDPNLKAGIDLFVKDYKAIFVGENNILAQLQRLYNE